MDGRSIDVIIGGDVRSGITGVRICHMHGVRMMPDIAWKGTYPLFRKCEYSVTSCEEQLHTLSNSLLLFIFFRGHFHLHGLHWRRSIWFESLDKNFTITMWRVDGGDAPVRPI